MEIKISTASPGDAPVAIPDENDESPTTSSTQASSTHQLQAPLINPDWALEALDDDPQPPTPTSMEDEFAPPAPKSPLKSPLRQSTAPESNENEEIREMQQKILQQQEALRQKQEEIEAEEKALVLQTSDSEDEGLQQYYEHLVNPPFVNDSLSPSPTLQQDFVPFGMNPYFNYPPQLAYMNPPQVSHQPINLQTANFQRSVHPSQYRRPRPASQPVQAEDQQQPLRQQSRSNDGAAAVPQPLPPQLQTNATPSQVEPRLPVETFNIFNKIRQQFKDRSFHSNEDFVKLVELREKDVHVVFNSILSTTIL